VTGLAIWATAIMATVTIVSNVAIFFIIISWFYLWLQK
jgi:hypothetical protein